MGQRPDFCKSCGRRTGATNANVGAEHYVNRRKFVSVRLLFVRVLGYQVQNAFAFHAAHPAHMRQHCIHVMAAEIAAIRSWCSEIVEANLRVADKADYAGLGVNVCYSSQCKYTPTLDQAP